LHQENSLDKEAKYFSADSKGQVLLKMKAQRKSKIGTERCLLNVF